MRFSIIAAAFAAVAAAQYSADETCALVTVTVTKTLAHTPMAPSSHAATGPAPYPTSAIPYPSAPAGTGSPSSPVMGGTGYPVKPSGTAAPSGTGAYSAPVSQFTGAASSVKVGGVVAAGAFAALFL